MPWEGSLGSPTGESGCSLLHLGVEVMVEEGKGEAVQGKEVGGYQGLPQRSLRPLRLDGGKKRSERNGLKSIVPWSLYHHNLPSPSKNFHL